MGREIAIQQPQLPAFSMGDIEKVATAIARGGLFGSKDPYAVLTLCMLAHAEGQHPAVVFRDYDLIQGKPAKKAEAMLRDFIGSGGKVTWNRLDDECAEAVFSHPQGGEVTINWTLARATKAGLGGKDMWKKYPRQMLRSRVVSEGVRTVCPNATSGLYVPEEVRDFAPDTTPSDTPPTPAAKRARDLKPERTAIEAKPDPKRAKAEDWLAWLRDEIGNAGGEVDAVRTIFDEAGPTLTKLAKEYPDLHAEAMKLAPSPDAQPGLALGEETVGQKKGAEIKAQLESAEDAEAVETIIADADKHRDAFDEATLTSLEIAFDQARKRFETAEGVE